MDNFFLKTFMYNRDGVNYEVLNKYTLEMDKWDKGLFFEGVKNINHF